MVICMSLKMFKNAFGWVNAAWHYWETALEIRTLERAPVVGTLFLGKSFLYKPDSGTIDELRISQKIKGFRPPPP